MNRVWGGRWSGVAKMDGPTARSAELSTGQSCCAATLATSVICNYSVDNGMAGPSDRAI